MSMYILHTGDDRLGRCGSRTPIAFVAEPLMLVDRGAGLMVAG